MNKIFFKSCYTFLKSYISFTKAQNQKQKPLVQQPQPREKKLHFLNGSVFLGQRYTCSVCVYRPLPTSLTLTDCQNDLSNCGITRRDPWFKTVIGHLHLCPILRIHKPFQKQTCLYPGERSVIKMCLYNGCITGWPRAHALSGLLPSQVLHR